MKANIKIIDASSVAGFPNLLNSSTSNLANLLNLLKFESHIFHMIFIETDGRKPAQLHKYMNFCGMLY